MWIRTWYASLTRCYSFDELHQLFGVGLELSQTDSVELDVGEAEGLAVFAFVDRGDVFGEQSV